MPEGKIALITGGARGMGRVTAKALAERSIEKVLIVDWEGEEGTRTRDAINASTGRDTCEFVYCDLSSMTQVKALADSIAERFDTLDILVNNAGITDPVRRLSEDGLEMHLATCHLSHFILSNRLLPLLANSDDGRIVFVSSDAHKAGPGLDFDDFNNEKIWKGKTISSGAAFQAYHRAKLCNIYTMQELHERLQNTGIAVNALSPGYFVNTDIYRNMRGVMKFGAKFVFGIGTLLGLNTPERGARSHIWLASSDEARALSGKYIEHCKEKAMGPPTEDDEARKRLWALSEEITGVSFPALKNDARAG